MVRIVNQQQGGVVMNAQTVDGGSAAIRGAMERAIMLPPLNPHNEGSPSPVPFLAAWSNNWADWDNYSGHNNWENGNPSPPGG